MSMDANFTFEDNSARFLEQLDETCIGFLYEVKDSLVSQTQRNTPVKTGDLKRSFDEDSFVDERKLAAYIGSSKEYAMWVEKGTGEYAVEGNGRRGGWFYKDEDGKIHKTYGMKPRLMLYQAYITKKSKISKEAGKYFARLNQR